MNNERVYAVTFSLIMPKESINITANIIIMDNNYSIINTLYIQYKIKYNE